ncbi:MAG: tripartite tricarboxylate transporter substrate binding protein [Ramlibacter sp.]|nr:tripartite tricarboxylate transporter substrate binding protein [Ramlibacter sp.]
MKKCLSRLLAAAALLAACAAGAAEFPNQPIRIVLPFGPGGGTDVVARSLAEKLAPVFGVPVVVDNKPGGNSVIASRQVATAPPDGHTLLLTTDIHAINAAYGGSLPYDSLKDFAFVTQLTTSPLMLLAHPSAGLRSLADVVAQAKARPGRLSFASLGSSSPHYLGFEWFKRMAGVEMIDVPYKGGGQALVDLLGGQVNLSLIVAGNGIKQAKAGKLVALAITSPSRNAVAPDVPTFAESGFPEFSLLNWYAIMAPAGTPPAVVTRLAREIGHAMRDPAVVERVRAAGLDPVTGAPADLEALVRRDIERYRRIIALTGAKPEER